MQNAEKRRQKDSEQCGKEDAEERREEETALSPHWHWHQPLGEECQ
jgi:hypothetical protein